MIILLCVVLIFIIIIIKNIYWSLSGIGTNKNTNDYLLQRFIIQ